MPNSPHRATPIVPCNDLEASTRFYGRLGFTEVPPDAPYRAEYRILQDGAGGEIHLQPAVPGWVVPGRNPFGVYLMSSHVREIAAAFGKELQMTDYGAIETVLSDPDETLARVGWPIPRFRARTPGRPGQTVIRMPRSRRRKVSRRDRAARTARRSKSPRIR
jgi:catechol 2,3-dioxygenase-like lactoylglutathione lyase family enzyme